MKVLIAVVTCIGNNLRIEAQRKTWVPQVEGADVRFFVGDSSLTTQADVYLPVGDGYFDLPNKVKAIFKWGLDQGYDYIFKVDDDVYLRPERLLSCGFENNNYYGVCQPKNSYASGFIYCLSSKAARLVVESQIEDWAEDRMVGVTLSQHGIMCCSDSRHVILYDHKHNNLYLGTSGPRRWNDIISAGELEPENMFDEHFLWCNSNVSLEKQRYMSDFLNNYKENK
jgi:hypothetical protein